ncbi:MAG: hypothetical protein WCY89_06265 [Flavobacteriaceae bacterium]
MKIKTIRNTDLHKFAQIVVSVKNPFERYEFELIGILNTDLHKFAQIVVSVKNPFEWYEFELIGIF